MREYELIIDEALKHGLSEELITPFNNQSLYKCYGFRCGKLGLELASVGSNPIPLAIPMYYSWPFPQVFVRDTYNILIIRNTATGSDLIYTFSNDFSIIALIATVASNNLWEFVDFGEYAFMTNGETFVYFDPTTATWQTSAAIATIPMIGTVCNLCGQAIGGNVSGVWYDCDETFYIWSKIGSMDFTPEIDNEAGYRRCPYGGTVYHTRAMGQGSVIGYSSKGITMIYPVSEPMSVMGFKKVSNIGLLNMGAVDGDDTEHVYIGVDKRIRRIDEEGVKELGYAHLVNGLSGTVIVKFDRLNRDYYISDGTKTFLLSQYGMSEVMQHPSAVWRINGDLYMLPDTVDDDYFQITTEPFNLGYSGQKTIATIESDLTNVVSPYAAVDCSYNLTTWISSNFSSMNNEGIATVIAAGNYFRFKLRFTSVNELFKIGYIKPRYKMTDLRGIRGVYAPPIRGQQ